MKITKKLAALLAILTALLLFVMPLSAYYLPEPALNKWDGKSATRFQYGDGSKGNPYQIRTGAELKYFADKVNSGTTFEWKYVILVNDIDLNNTNWTPIGDDFTSAGTNDVSFEGNFDGNGRTVKNFSINDTDEYCGFFGNAALGSVSNLHLDINSVTGTNYVGGLMGRAFQCTVSNCTVTCKKISGRSYVGGMFGGIEGAMVTNCYANVKEVIAAKRTAGAFAGWTLDYDSTDLARKVTDCLAVSGITSAAKDRVGGFVGDASDYTFENCFVTGTAPVCTGTDKSMYHAFAGTYKNCTFKNCAHTFSNLTDPKVAKKNIANLGMSDPGQWYTSTYINGGVPYMKGWERVSFPFFDVEGGSWYADAVAFCYQKDYVSGVSYSRFGTNNYVTRGQFVQILAKIDGVNLSNIKYEAKFSDVPKGKWYTNAVLWAVNNGFASGVGYGKFWPETAVTRAQLASFMRTYAEKKGKDVSKKTDLERFWDSYEIPGWAYEPLAWAVGSGIISGDNKDNLMPKQYATRAQVAVIVRSFCEKILGK